VREPATAQEEAKQQTTIKQKNVSARSGTSSNVMPSSSRTTLTAPKGGVVKTVVLPHEDFNKLGVEG